MLFLAGGFSLRRKWMLVKTPQMILKITQRKACHKDVLNNRVGTAQRCDDVNHQCTSHRADQEEMGGEKEHSQHNYVFSTFCPTC